MSCMSRSRRTMTLRYSTIAWSSQRFYSVDGVWPNHIILHDMRLGWYLHCIRSHYIAMAMKLHAETDNGHNANTINWPYLDGQWGWRDLGTMTLKAYRYGTGYTPWDLSQWWSVKGFIALWLETGPWDWQSHQMQIITTHPYTVTRVTAHASKFEICLPHSGSGSVFELLIESKCTSESQLRSKSGDVNWVCICVELKVECNAGCEEEARLLATREYVGTPRDFLTT